jgi:hypothetical protein
VLGTNFVEELLGMVDQGQLEENLIHSIAAGVPAETVAPGISARRSVVIARVVRQSVDRDPVPCATVQGSMATGRTR